MLCNGSCLPRFLFVPLSVDLALTENSGSTFTGMHFGRQHGPTAVHNLPFRSKLNSRGDQGFGALVGWHSGFDALLQGVGCLLPARSMS